MTYLLCEVLKPAMLQKPTKRVKKGALNVFFFNICGPGTSGIHLCFNVNKFYMTHS